MEMFKVNLHSAVDVITNSSTTIFTYSEGSDKKAVELINELLGVLGSDLKAEDMFYMGVFLDDTDYLLERIGDRYWGKDGCDIELMKEEGCEDSLIEAINDDNFSANDLIEKILKGEISKPKWLSDDDDDQYSTTLYVLPKEEKYTAVAKKITEFLYSTEYEEGYE